MTTAKTPMTPPVRLPRTALFRALAVLACASTLSLAAPAAAQSLGPGIVPAPQPT